MIDTHCHIHSSDYPLDGRQALANARDAGLATLLCVGTSAEDSRRAVDFANANNVYCSIAQHPHDASKLGRAEKQLLEKLVAEPRVVAVGECGLDYYYNFSDKAPQQKSLRWHIELAQSHGLPMVFHIREAFADFWPIFDEYNQAAQIHGLVHSFSAGTFELEAALARGLYIGINGIMTFTKNERQLAALKACPHDRMVFETDAPFLTPVPYRGRINEPKYLVEVVKRVADIRGEDFTELAQNSTLNAKQLFKL